MEGEGLDRHGGEGWSIEGEGPGIIEPGEAPREHLSVMQMIWTGLLSKR